MDLTEIGIAGVGVIHRGGRAGKRRLGRGGAHARRRRLAGGKMPLHKPNNDEDQCCDKKKPEHQWFDNDEN